MANRITSMMTLEAMKLAVCEKLPKLVRQSRNISAKTGTLCNDWCWLGDSRPIHWDTEGLAICHEAEKLLTGYNSATRKSEYGCYVTELQRITNWNKVPCASYEQRLEALCQVWFPERFQK